MAVGRLTAGQAFHRAVQSTFLAGLAGASGFRERQWRLIRGGRGRVDLALRWTAMSRRLSPTRSREPTGMRSLRTALMWNLRRHLRQLQAYLDTAIEDMEAGRWESVAGALLYPGRPASVDRWQ